MSFFANREMIVSGFAIGAISIVIGIVLLFTREARIDQLYAYVLGAAGVVLIFASALARGSSRNTWMLRLTLAAFALFLLLGYLLKDAIERAY